MQHVVGWCRLTNACRPRPMSPSQCSHAMSNACIWCCYQLKDVTKLMHASHDQCHQVDAHTPQLMCTGCCCKSLADVAYPICAGHNWCHLTDALRAWLNSPDPCSQPTPDYGWVMCTSHDLCRLSKKHVGGAMCTSHDWCRKSITIVAWPMLHSVGQHFLHKAYKPWLMMPIAWRWYPPADAHTPRLMHVGLCWCCLSLANLAWPMKTLPCSMHGLLGGLILWRRFYLLELTSFFFKDLYWTFTI